MLLFFQFLTVFNCITSGQSWPCKEKQALRRAQACIRSNIRYILLNLDLHLHDLWRRVLTRADAEDMACREQ